MHNANKSTTMTFRGISVDKAETEPKTNFLIWIRGLALTSALYLTLFYFVTHGVK